MTARDVTELSLEEVRAVQLGVLVAFDRICRAQALTYYLAYGTLLGAVRHGGYIPWDDDVDVMMPRADYDRLLEVFPQVAPPHLTLGSSPTRADWPFPWAKVGDARTTLWEPLDRPLPLSVNLDVFPLDALPAGRLSHAVQTKILQLLRWAVELRYVSAVRGRAWHGPLAIAVGKPLLRLVPARALVAAFTWTARSAGAPGASSGVRVGSFDWSVPTAKLGVPVELDFEQLPLLAPADPAAVLTQIYGDYTQLPAEELRVSEHAFTASWHSTSR